MPHTVYFVKDTRGKRMMCSIVILDKMREPKHSNLRNHPNTFASKCVIYNVWRFTKKMHKIRAYVT